MASSNKKSARHTKESFDDQEAIGLLSVRLARTKRAMPDLKANDKRPNIDGYIEMTDQDGFPVGSLKVQVKKIPPKKAKSKKYSFTNSKFLSYCKEDSDGIPILLIAVDTANQIAYRVKMNKNNLIALGDKRTISLFEEQVIKDGDDSYIHDWLNIIQENISKLAEFEKYKMAYATLSDVITPALGKSKAEFVNVHKFLDELNNFLDWKTPIVKDLFYPGMWKVGFAYYRYEESFLSYTLYPIPYNKNDIQIKEVGNILHKKIEKQGLGFTAFMKANPIENEPLDHAMSLIKKKVLTILDQGALNHLECHFLANEYLVGFIDEFTEQLGLEKKDLYSIGEVEIAFYKFLPIWLDEAYKYLINNDINNFKKRMGDGRVRYYDPSRISEIIDSNVREKISSNAHNRMNNGDIAQNIFMGNKKFPLATVREMLDISKKKKKVTKIYKGRDLNKLSKKTPTIWGCYDKTNLIDDMKLVYKNIVNTYKTIVEYNFPGLSKELDFFGDASLILITLQFPSNYSHPNDQTGYKVYYLKNINNTKNVGEILLLNEDDSKEIDSQDWKLQKIKFKEIDYDLISMQISTPRFMTSKTPLLSLIYEILKTKLSKYFDSHAIK